MSLENLKAVIDRALADPTFWDLLYHQPEQAMTAYALEEHERALLRNLPSSPYTLAVQGLVETRKMVEAAMLYRPAAQKEVKP